MYWQWMLWPQLHGRSAFAGLQEMPGGLSIFFAAFLFALATKLPNLVISGRSQTRNDQAGWRALLSLGDDDQCEHFLQLFCMPFWVWLERRRVRFALKVHE